MTVHVMASRTGLDVKVWPSVQRCGLIVCGPGMPVDGLQFEQRLRPVRQPALCFGELPPLERANSSRLFYLIKAFITRDDAHLPYFGS